MNGKGRHARCHHETRNSGDLGIDERYGYSVRQFEKKKKRRRKEKEKPRVEDMGRQSPTGRLLYLSLGFGGRRLLLGAGVH